MALRAYKYRIYPNRSQQQYLNQNFGAVRFLWNQLVANFNSHDPSGPNKHVTEKTIKDTAGNEWMHDMISYALQQKRMDFEEAKRQFFNKNRKTKLGRMKFKKKGVSQDSFRIPGSVLPKSNREMCTTGKIQLPKMDLMKVVIDRPFKGEIRSFTVSRNSCNQYFVSVLVEEPIELKQNTGRAIGIDLGLKDFATLSDGSKISNPRWFYESQVKLKKAQQHLSRKQKGSNRYKKQQLKVARIHLKIANQRKHFIHNMSTWLINSYDTIVVEDLNVEGMKKLFGKSVSDVGLATFVSMLDYKSQWYGKTLHKIDRWFPSSKTCSCCGFKLDQLDLAAREWECPSCGANHDRDINAATNILEQGLNDLYGLTSAEFTDYRRGEIVSPACSGAFSMKRLACSVY